MNHDEGRIVIGTNNLTYTNPGETLTDFTTVNSTVALVTQNGTEKYVKVTSSGTTAGTGVFPIGGTFPVNAGEVYRIRVKGYRTGTNPAYILIKTSGVSQGWPGATLASTVATEAWTEQYVTIPTGSTTLQAGVEWNTVASGEIMYINEFEITKIGSGTPEYQYHLKDHLGNVRTTFTTVQSTDQTTGTYEPANQALEQSQYVRYSNAKLINATLFNHTTSGSYSERLNGSANEKYGLAKSISVMPGDVISTEVYAKYVDPVSSNWTPALSTLMSQIAAGTAGVVIDGANYSTSTSSFPFAGLLSTTGSTGGPKAYLNWIIFDRNYVMITGGYQRLSAAPKETGNNVAHERLFSPNINITQPGYVYIYLSNEETTPVEVYFDDFKVTQTKSPVLAQDDYYPFGLSFNSYQRENVVPNPYKYNGKEFQDEIGIGWLDYGARVYLPDLGRWSQVDPMSEHYEKWSTYHFAANNPINIVDPDGQDWYQTTGGITMWKKGSDAIDGYTNIGANYTLDIGSGVSITYTQDKATAISESVLKKEDWESQMSDDGKQVLKQCYYVAKAISAKSGAEVDATMDKRVYTGTETGSSEKDHKVISTINAKKGISIIDKNIDNGNSTVVGVDFLHGTNINDETTDHFIAISGRTTNLVTGEKAYNFFDPGTSKIAAGTSSQNVLTLQGDLLKGTTAYSSSNHYVVTQVRPNK